MLIAMAGLPGSGKSTLAVRIAVASGGVVLSKDVVRAALFAAAVLDYSSEQDEIAMTAVYQAAAYLLKTRPAIPVFLDGRTFSKAGQLDSAASIAAEARQPFRVIECVCAPDVARARVAADHAAAAHLAGNRTPDLYDRVRANAVPLTVPRLTIDTGALTLNECVAQALAYLGG
ncbi:ATP-binding protein [Gemmata sp. JC717]|uniref:ATP-binding protein n=1 Tax=Gemmata algarum TaxID=2975278 RepID=A0ABU5F5Y5_9BACT|nr:ATP-binding protein [Gemmata algarum]MDY3554556.1 ATP-binding protein [Gemmata algarum]MDY3562730.1 ATP-binding protein [Gemmata algarum]